MGGKCIFEWEFGDDKGEVLNGGRDVWYCYESGGFYRVRLEVSKCGGLEVRVDKSVVVCDYGDRGLGDRIYKLMD